MDWGIEVRAILLGGTGAIGGATALLLAMSGWTVEVTGRDQSRMPQKMTDAGVRFHQIDRSDTRSLERLAGDGADLLVDLVACSAPQVRALLPAMTSMDNLVLISSRAVYVDDFGGHVNGDEPPRFTAPIREDGPTLPPAPDDMNPYTREGYAPCKVAAEHAALDSGLPVTVIRPSKVHGRWARNARTSSIVDWMLSGNQSIELAHADTVDHLHGSKECSCPDQHRRDASEPPHSECRRSRYPNGRGNRECHRRGARMGWAD
ncbi:NAD-dependent epimerase/dehydratase family protein [Specibacter cremeus]|uniref:NAD-dependent epimerase/dehydratase family protein n=1 Tax=Specibacter cremeus TaxID=1629051 RepID=UPI001F0C824C|nr:NAD-dependent epimerase/dehydratase family protein [Specibacter cremeus]